MINSGSEECDRLDTAVGSREGCGPPMSLSVSRNVRRPPLGFRDTGFHTYWIGCGLVVLGSACWRQQTLLPSSLSELSCSFMALSAKNCTMVDFSPNEYPEFLSHLSLSL